ncbi:MAG: PTS sugar transporter subunit IIA [Lacticaseibacillus paracasei]
MVIQIFATEGTNDVQTYQDAINLAGNILASSGSVVHGFSQACIDREREFPTGLGLNDTLGIAIPHGNSKLVKKSSISFVRLARPVDFGRMEDNTQTVPCKFLFNLALEEGTQHLTTLRHLMKLFQDNNFIQKISNLPLDKLSIYLTEKVVAEELTH